MRRPQPLKKPFTECHYIRTAVNSLEGTEGKTRTLCISIEERTEHSSSIDIPFSIWYQRGTTDKVLGLGQGRLGPDRVRSAGRAWKVGLTVALLTREQMKGEIGGFRVSMGIRK